jgi:Tfp pilus assembly protein PilF
MIALGLGDLAARSRSVSKVTAVGAVACLAALLAATWFQVGVWRDSRSLFKHTLSVTSENAATHNNLGIALYEEGDDPGARRHFEEALRIRPKFQLALHNLAIVHFSLGKRRLRENDIEQAAYHFAKACEIDPQHPQAAKALEKLQRMRRTKGG